MALADAHLHLFSRGFPGRYGRSVLGNGSQIEAYEAFRAAHNIHLGLVVGYEANGIDPHNNDYIRLLAVDRPWMATLAFADPYQELHADKVERWIAEGHIGIAMYLPDASSSAGVAEWSGAVWRTLESHHSVISVNASPKQIDLLAPVVAERVGCTFMFSHLGLPGRYQIRPSTVEAADRLDPLLRLAALPNTMVKISGLYAISEPAHDYPHAAAAPFIGLLLERFGPERCVWGSDFSPALDFVSFAQTLSNCWLDRLTRAERDSVMGGNLLALLGLKTTLLSGEDT
jgi:predicted TIM-barrel fold metal-dependent hydrolase